MTNNGKLADATDADRDAAKEILGCLDVSANDHAYDELLLILIDHRIAAEKRRQDVTALYAYEAGFEGAESILREQVERMVTALTRAESDFHLIALDGGVTYTLQQNAKLSRDKCRQALADCRKFTKDNTPLKW